jgi:UDP-glucose 4-epimerase
MVEEIIRDWCRSKPQNSAALLRYFNPVGAHASGDIGEDPRGAPNNLMPFVAQVAVGRRSHLSVFGNDYATADGTGERDYIHVSDVAEAFARALVYEGSEQVFNVATGRGTSLNELIRIIASVTGLPGKVNFKPGRPFDVPVSVLDNRRAQQELGWSPVIELHEGIRRTAHWMRDKGV